MPTSTILGNAATIISFRLDGHGCRDPFARVPSGVLSRGADQHSELPYPFETDYRRCDIEVVQRGDTQIATRLLLDRQCFKSCQRPIQFWVSMSNEESESGDKTKPRFSVDTHVFRELGELLVGRDSTALVELIKNSYDADATEVVVYGEKLDDLENGSISVADDGVGMSAKAFTEGFLRIAARTKDTGDRRSTRFRRRYTGAKGIASRPTSWRACSRWSRWHR
jgi:hypothetical protein